VPYKISVAKENTSVLLKTPDGRPFKQITYGDAPLEVNDEVYQLLEPQLARLPEGVIRVTKSRTGSSGGGTKGGTTTTSASTTTSRRSTGGSGGGGTKSGATSSGGAAATKKSADK